MKIIKDHYDKIIFSCSLVLIGCFFMIHYVFDKETELPNINYKNNGFFEIQENGSEVRMSFFREMDLMPGHFIFAELDSGETIQTSIERVFFKRRSNISVFSDKGKKVDGRISSNQDLLLERKWRTQRGSVNLETKTGTQSLPFASIVKILGNGSYSLDRAAKSIDWETASVSVYQPKIFQTLESNQTTRIKWQKRLEDSNASIYDTFTPPVIYLINGRLTTKLPQEPVLEAEKEAFGLELTDFSQRPYPHMLKRWIGNTPYFEDQNTPIAPNSNQNVFNRLEVGKTYRTNSERKPGQPSLIECEKSHPDAKITVEYFTAQQVPTKTGGRMLVGRAMVKDHDMDSKPFEVNSLMKEVFAGDYSIKIKFNLPGLPGKEFEFSQDDNGTAFEHESRKYRIEKIDLDNKSLLISKEGTILQKPDKIILTLPLVDPLR